VEATYWRIKWYGAWLAGGVGILAAYFVGFELLRDFVRTQDTLHLAANIYIVCIAALALIITLFRQWTSIRKEKYANITPLIHQILHQIRDLNTFIHTAEPKGGSEQLYEIFIRDCKTIFGRILDQVNSVFISITSTHCRASIKLTYQKNGKIYVYTLTRDQGSRQRHLKLDNQRVEADHDPLDENPQFARLFSDDHDSWHYMCNNLPRESDFRCTSVTAYAPDHATRAASQRRLPWPLPYRSTIACVIRQSPFDLHPTINAEVLGFLTIDSESRGVFEERWDVQIMFAVADALYGPVRAYLDAQNRSQRGTL
jgi:hypothetical protein